MCISWFKCIYLCILGAYAQYSDDILPSFWVQWDGLDDSNDDGPVGKRVLPPFDRKPHPSPTCAHKVRKKWTETEEKTLLEGVAKWVIFSVSLITLPVLTFCSNFSKVTLHPNFVLWRTGMAEAIGKISKWRTLTSLKTDQRYAFWLAFHFWPWKMAWDWNFLAWCAGRSEGQVQKYAKVHDLDLRPGGSASALLCIWSAWGTNLAWQDKLLTFLSKFETIKVTKPLLGKAAVGSVVTAIKSSGSW